MLIFMVLFYFGMVYLIQTVPCTIPYSFASITAFVNIWFTYQIWFYNHEVWRLHNVYSESLSFRGQTLCVQSEPALLHFSFSL